MILIVIILVRININKSVRILCWQCDEDWEPGPPTFDNKESNEEYERASKDTITWSNEEDLDIRVCTPSQRRYKQKECADKYYMCYQAIIKCDLKKIQGRFIGDSSTKTYHLLGCAGRSKQTTHNTNIPR